MVVGTPHTIPASYAHDSDYITVDRISSYSFVSSMSHVSLSLWCKERWNFEGDLEVSGRVRSTRERGHEGRLCINELLDCRESLEQKIS